MSKPHRTQVRDIRRKLARTISETGLPGSMLLSGLVRSREDNEDLQRSAKAIVDAMEAGDRKLEEARQYPALGPWLTPEEIAKHNEVGGEVLMRSALTTADSLGTLAQLDQVYARFVRSSAVHRAIMQFWLFLPKELEEQGFGTLDAEGLHFNDLKNEYEQIEHFLYRRYAERITKQDAQLNYDEVLAQLKQIYD